MMKGLLLLRCAMSLSFMEELLMSTTGAYQDIKPFVPADREIGVGRIMFLNVLNQIPEYKKYCSFINEKSYYESVKETYLFSSYGSDADVFKQMLVRIITSWKAIGQKSLINNEFNKIFGSPQLNERCDKQRWANIEKCLKYKIIIQDNEDHKNFARCSIISPMLGKNKYLINHILNRISDLLLSSTALSHQIQHNGLSLLMNALKKLNLLLSNNDAPADLSFEENHGKGVDCKKSKKFIKNLLKTVPPNKHHLMKSMLSDYLQGMTSVIASLGYLKNFHSGEKDFIVIAAELRLLNCIFNSAFAIINTKQVRYDAKSYVVNFNIDSIDNTLINSVSNEVKSKISLFRIILLTESSLLKNKDEHFGNIKSHNKERVCCVKTFQRKSLQEIVLDLNISIFSLFSLLSGISNYFKHSNILSMTLDQSDFFTLNKSDSADFTKSFDVHSRIFCQMSKYPRLAVVSNTQSSLNIPIENVLESIRLSFSIYNHLDKDYEADVLELFDSFSATVIESLENITVQRSKKLPKYTFSDIFIFLDDIRRMNIDKSLIAMLVNNNQHTNELDVKNGRIFKNRVVKNKNCGLSHLLKTIESHIKFLSRSDTKFEAIKGKLHDVLKEYLKLMANNDSGEEKNRSTSENRMNNLHKLINEIMCWAVEDNISYNFQNILYFKQLVNGLSFLYTIIQFSIERSLWNEKGAHMRYIIFENIHDAIYNQLLYSPCDEIQDDLTILQLIEKNGDNEIDTEIVCKDNKSFYKTGLLNGFQIFELLFKSAIKTFIVDKNDTKLLREMVRFNIIQTEEKKRVGSVSSILNFLLIDSSKINESKFSFDHSKIENESFKLFKDKCHKLQKTCNIKSSRYLDLLKNSLVAFLQINLNALCNIGYYGLYLIPEDRVKYQLERNSNAFIEVLKIMYLLQCLNRITGLEDSDDCFKCDIMTHFVRLFNNKKFLVFFSDKVQDFFGFLLNDIFENKKALSKKIAEILTEEKSKLEEGISDTELKKIVMSIEKGCQFCKNKIKEIKNIKILLSLPEDSYLPLFANCIDKSTIYREEFEKKLIVTFRRMCVALDILEARKQAIVNNFLDKFESIDRKKVIYENLDSNGWNFVLEYVNLKSKSSESGKNGRYVSFIGKIKSKSNKNLNLKKYRKMLNKKRRAISDKANRILLKHITERNKVIGEEVDQASTETNDGLYKEELSDLINRSISEAKQRTWVKYTENSCKKSAFSVQIIILLVLIQYVLN